MYRPRKTLKYGKMQKGGTLYEYLLKNPQYGKAFAEYGEKRKQLASELGIRNYEGSAEQNLSLLALLQSGKTELPYRGGPNTTTSSPKIERTAPVQQAQFYKGDTTLPYRGGPNANTSLNKPVIGGTFDNMFGMQKAPVIPAPRPTVRQEPPRQNRSQFYANRQVTPLKNEKKQPISSPLPISQPMAGVSGTVTTQNPKEAGVLSGLLEMPELIDRYGTLAINGLKRAWEKRFGDDNNAKSIIKASIPQKDTTVVTPPIIVGDTIPDGDRMYHIPEIIDLNRVKLGARNRGENNQVVSDGLIFSNFDNNKIVSTKSNILNPLQLYIGVDGEGAVKIGKGNEFGDKEYQVSPFNSKEITGFAKDDAGNYNTVDASNSAQGHVMPTLRGSDGNPVPINLLVKKGNDKAFETFGDITGGRAIFTSPDFKEKILFSGSVKNIDDQLQKWMSSKKLSKVNYISVDNGSFSRGTRTKDGIIKPEDWKASDLRNSWGNHGFYLKGKGYKYGGSLPEAQKGMQYLGAGIIGLNVLGNMLQKDASQIIPSSPTPLPYQQFQPNPFSLYAQYGGKIMKKGGVFNYRGSKKFNNSAKMDMDKY